MNRRLIIAMMAVVILGVVAAVGLLMMRPSDNAANTAFQSASNPQPGKSGKFKPASDGADGTDAKGKNSGKTGTSATGTGSRVSAGPGGKQGLDGAPGALGAKSKYGPEYWANLNFFENPERLEELLKEFGGYEGLYAAAPPDVRSQIINYLLTEGKLRSEIADLLPLETDSMVRADMLTKVLPEGIFDDTGSVDRPVDNGMKDILERKMPSPIGEGEWLARIDLAKLIDPDYAIDTAKQAESAIPDSDTVRISSAAATLQLAAGGAEVSKEEIKRAETYLFAQMDQPSWINTEQENRIQAYYGIYYSSDKARTRKMLETALKNEPDGQPKTVVQELLALL